MNMPKKLTIPFSPQHVALAQFAHALSHPARVAIVSLLLEQGDRCCGEIVDALPLAQPTVSRHLKELVNAGLLQDQAMGVKVCYSLRHDRIKTFCAAFRVMLGQDDPAENPAGTTTTTS